MEILHKEGNGRNRQKVIANLSGMTGSSQTAITQEDADVYAIFKQDIKEGFIILNFVVLSTLVYLKNIRGRKLPLFINKNKQNE